MSLWAHYRTRALSFPYIWTCNFLLAITQSCLQLYVPYASSSIISQDVRYIKKKRKRKIERPVTKKKKKKPHQEQSRVCAPFSITVSTSFSGTCVTTRKPNSTSRTPLGAEPVWRLGATPLRLIIAVRLATRNFGQEQRSNGAKAATQSSNLNAAYSRCKCPFLKSKELFSTINWTLERCKVLAVVSNLAHTVARDAEFMWVRAW